MATNILPMTTLTISASAAPNTNRRRTTTNNNNNKWWTPLFGWSSNPDYIDNTDTNTDTETTVSRENNNNNNNNNNNETTVSRENNNNNNNDEAPVRRTRFNPGCFTEEKAKQLRLMTKESFHDVMYHSAIASRLASDFSDQNNNNN